MSNPHINSFLKAKYRGPKQASFKYESPPTKQTTSPQTHSFPVRYSTSSKPSLEPKKPPNLRNPSPPPSTSKTYDHQRYYSSEPQATTNLTTSNQEYNSRVITTAEKKFIILPPKGTNEVQVNLRMTLQTDIALREDGISKPIRLSFTKEEPQKSIKSVKGSGDLLHNSFQQNLGVTTISQQNNAYSYQLNILQSWQKAQQTILCSTCGQLIQILQLFQHHRIHEQQLADRHAGRLTTTPSQLKSSLVINQPELQDDLALRFSTLTHNTDLFSSTAKKPDFQQKLESSSLFIAGKLFEQGQDELGKPHELSYSMQDSLPKKSFSGSNDKGTVKSRLMWNKRKSENISAFNSRDQDHQEDIINSRISSLHPQQHS